MLTKVIKIHSHKTKKFMTKNKLVRSHQEQKIDDNSNGQLSSILKKNRDASPSTFQVSSSGATFDNPRGMTVQSRVWQLTEAGLRLRGRADHF